MKDDLSSVAGCKSAPPLSHISAASADQCGTSHCHAKPDSPGASKPSASLAGLSHWALRHIRHLSLAPGVPSICRSAAADRDVAPRTLCVRFRTSCCFLAHIAHTCSPLPVSTRAAAECEGLEEGKVGWGGTLPSRLFNKAAVCVCRHTWTCSYFTSSPSGCEVLASGSASSGFGDNLFYIP